ncbi:hypothetical protein DL96DRAFT_1585732 [Flagelloscypha sp. PMI_526]|nr:hypothetical protein DL96DRAFT_1585732 [Flagelloscypha sp. PMI_526]
MFRSSFVATRSSLQALFLQTCSNVWIYAQELHHSTPQAYKPSILRCYHGLSAACSCKTVWFLTTTPSAFLSFIFPSPSFFSPHTMYIRRQEEGDQVTSLTSDVPQSTAVESSPEESSPPVSEDQPQSTEEPQSPSPSTFVPRFLSEHFSNILDIDSTVPATAQTGTADIFGLTASTTPSGSKAGKTQTTTSQAELSGASSKPLSPGVIALIVICMVFVALALVAVAFNVRRRRLEAKHGRKNSDARSTIMWDKPPRPFLRGPSLSLKPKKFAPPSHTFMQPTSSYPMSPQTGDTHASSPFSATSPFADPLPVSTSGSDNPFADPPQNRHESYHGALAV